MAYDSWRENQWTGARIAHLKGRLNNAMVIYNEVLEYLGKTNQPVNQQFSDFFYQIANQPVNQQFLDFFYQIPITSPSAL